MLQSIFTLKENRLLCPGVYKMTLLGNTDAITAPGQFVNIRLDGLYLRRPISVCDWDRGQLVIIYKVVGRGTEQMSALTPGEGLDILTGLGNGFDLSVPCRRPLLIGGGAGAAPMYALAKELLRLGKEPRVILGFNTKSEIYLRRELEALGATVTVTTADGSEGTPGFVTAAMDGEYDYYFACGPEPMLRAVYNACEAPGQLSFESRMGCGFGACMGCSCRTVTGYKRICKDGPVLKKEEIIWTPL